MTESSFSTGKNIAETVIEVIPLSHEGQEIVQRSIEHYRTRHGQDSSPNLIELERAIVEDLLALPTDQFLRTSLEIRRRIGN